MLATVESARKARQAIVFATWDGSSASMQYGELLLQGAHDSHLKGVCALPGLRGARFEDYCQGTLRSA